MDAAKFMPGAAAVAGIQANLEVYEAERAAVHRQVRLRVPGAVGGVAILVLAIGWVFNGVADPNEQWLSTPHVFLYLCGFVASILAYFWAVQPATRLQQSFRDTLLPIIFGFVEDFRYRHAATPASFDRLPRDTVGTFNRQSFDDVISGRFDGFGFELYEAQFKQRSGKRTSNVFSGVVVAFDTASPFPGMLVATRRSNAVAGFFRGLFGSKVSELQSGVPELDAAYEFRTDNVDAARPLVTGRLAQALGWLGETWPDEPARIALQGADGFLLLPHDKNFFELPPISRPVDYKEHVAPMIADLGAILATVSLVRKVTGD